MNFDSFLGLVGFLTIPILIFAAGALYGSLDGEKSGYIQCLQDIKHGKSPAYVLVEQANGTTKWERNKDGKNKHPSR